MSMMTEDTKVSLGSEARWPAPGMGAGDGCKLEVLDGNAVMIFTYDSSEKDSDPRSEQCRQGARDVAKKVHAAVHPR